MISLLRLRKVSTSPMSGRTTIARLIAPTSLIRAGDAVVAQVLKRKKQIAQEHAHENIKFVRSVVEEHMKLDIGPTWDALDEMRRERNLIAHGVWTMRFGGDSQGETAMPPEGLPMVLWHSKMLESDDFVTPESFHFWRFDKFMDRARVLLNTFLQFKTLAENAIEAEKRSRRF
jgi:hypothetical protein